MLTGFVAWLTFGEIPKGTTGSQGMIESRAVLALLEEFIDMAPFQQVEMPLKEFLLVMMEKFAAKGKDLPILVDKDSFRKSDRDFDIYDVQVRFLSHPKRMRVVEALRIALSQSEQPASFLIRRGTVVITPKKEASAKELLNQTVVANFYGRPLNEALDELSALTGASIVLDGRLGDKAKKPITATLKNDVSLGAALRMLTDMADLKVVVLDSGIYVTSPAAAQAMLKDLEKEQAPQKKRKKDR
jgi:hypothetical protein